MASTIDACCGHCTQQKGIAMKIYKIWSRIYPETALYTLHLEDGEVLHMLDTAGGAIAPDGAHDFQDSAILSGIDFLGDEEFADCMFAFNALQNLGGSVRESLNLEEIRAGFGAMSYILALADEEE